MQTEKQVAVLAAGCFWGVQDYFDHVPGIVNTAVGYTGGHVPRPTYEQVCSHTTGHAEAVRLEFDPNQIRYNDILRHFFRMHDPTQVNQQGLDIGDNYRSAIFYVNDDQKRQAQKVMTEVQKDFEKPIATEITKADQFYLAEDYHQKYVQKTGHGACVVPYSPL